MISVVTPSLRRGDADDPHLWDDLRVMLTSVEAYAPDGTEVVVGWDGPREPDRMPPLPGLRLLRRPDGLSASQAFTWCVERAAAELILIMGDDVVLHPDTVGLLLEDWELIESDPSRRVGILGARSNFVAGPQNVRWANGGELGPVRYSSEDQILAMASCIPIAALLRRDDYLAVGGFHPDLLWFNDRLLCFEMARMGRTHYGSRAYVHHVGARGTDSAETTTDAQRDAEALAWLAEHRPDFYAAVRQHLV